VPGLDSGGANRLDLVLFMDLASAARSSRAGIQEWLSILSQVAVTVPGLVSGARSFHPTDEAEEHAPTSGCGIDYASGLEYYD